MTRRKSKERRKDTTLTIRLNEHLLKIIKKRAAELGLSMGKYVHACLIYDLRFGDVSEYVKDLVKNHSVGYLVIPGIDSKYDEEMVKYWRDKQENIEQ